MLYLLLKQDGQCMYKVTLSRFRVTVVVVEKQQVFHVLSVCLYSCLSYPACKAHAPYYIVIHVLSGSTIFFHIIS